MNTLLRPPANASIASTVSRLWKRAVTALARPDAAKIALGHSHARRIGRLQAMWHRNHLSPHLALFGLSTPADLYLREARGLASHLNRRLSVLYVGAEGSGLGGALELHRSGLAEDIGVLAASASAATGLRSFAMDMGVQDTVRVLTREQAAVTGRYFDLIVLDQWLPDAAPASDLCRLLDRLLAEHGLIAWTGSVGCRTGAWPAVEQQICSQLDALGMQDPRPGVPARTSVDPAFHPADLVAALGKHFRFELFHTYGGAVLPYVETALAATLDAHEDTAVLLASIDRYDRQCLQEQMYPPARVLATLRRSVPSCMQQHVPLTPHAFTRLVAQHRLT